MRHEIIQAADPALVDAAARQCGELAIGCAETSGQVAGVIERVRQQIASLSGLQSVTRSLEKDQRQVADATDEARILSESVRLRLHDGRETVRKSSEDVIELTALIGRLGSQITSFATALEQVRRTTEVIDAIARTTNMLALNAAIEAERAGEAGATFAVVATEVKKLARDTRSATDEVAATMGSLTAEAETFMAEVRDGIARGRSAERSFSAITDTIEEVTHLVEQVDHQSEDIARSAAVIHESVCKVGEELDGFARSARANDSNLAEATERLDRLEQDAIGMFGSIVQSGFALEDGEMVDLALQQCERFKEITERALRDHSLTEATLFDVNYRLIPGSNPERFDTMLNEFADSFWRPELDRVLTLDPRIVSTACTDVNGYLPTHTTQYSRVPTGSAAYDAAYCRHRRILCDASDRVAKASTKPFHVSVFRREREGGGFDVLRNVYVPMTFNGRRWGDFEIAYRVS